MFGKDPLFFINILQTFWGYRWRKSYFESFNL